MAGVATVGAGVPLVAGGAATSAQAPPLGPDTVVPDLSEDPTSALRDALQEVAAAGGGTVLVSPGRHLLEGDLEVGDNVTLRGVSRTRCVLAMAGARVGFVPGVQGAALDSLTIDGGADGIVFRSGARFCTLRRLVVARSRRTGVRFDGGGYRHLAFDDVRIDQSGGDGFDLAADEACDSLFVSALSVGPVGLAGDAPAAAVRLAGRCHLSQVQIGPLAAEQVGVVFLEGSEHTTLSNYHITIDGGSDFEGAEIAAVGVGATQAVP